MNWVKVLAQDEFSQDAPKVVKVHNRAILLLHRGGQIYAVENASPLQGYRCKVAK